jgi:hypothetical protein
VLFLLLLEQLIARNVGQGPRAYAYGRCYLVAFSFSR